MEGIIADDWTLVSPGIYDLAFLHHETARMFGKAEKLILNFKIVTPGDAFEQRVARYYNVRQLAGRSGRNGRFKVGRGSEFMRDYALLFGAPARLDRIAMTKYRGVIIQGRVKTITTDHRQRMIPEPLRYSIVEELLEIAAGAPS